MFPEKPSFVMISEQEGFSLLPIESLSSKVFIKEGEVYKLTNRNSLTRQQSDLAMLRDRFVMYSEHIPESEICECQYEGETYTCVKQSVIDGNELKKLSEQELMDALKNNKQFLLALLEYFFDAISKGELYPDPIGFPKDPQYFNSVNLMLEKTSGKILLCDVGLSPHEDTLAKNGKAFFDSENVRTYTQRMKEFKEYMLSL